MQHLCALVSSTAAAAAHSAFAAPVAMNVLPEDWEAVPHAEQAKVEEIKRLSVSYQRAMIVMWLDKCIEAMLEGGKAASQAVLGVVPCHGPLFNATAPCLQVPENLGDIELATTLLHGGHPLQQKSVIERCEHAAACAPSAQERWHGLVARLRRST